MKFTARVQHVRILVMILSQTQCQKCALCPLLKIVTVPKERCDTQRVVNASIRKIVLHKVLGEIFFLLWLTLEIIRNIKGIMRNGKLIFL